MNNAVDLEMLFKAVLRDPDADAPRLAYAAGCDAKGDRERAEFIRIQIAHRESVRSGTNEWMAKFDRELQLKNRYGTRWAGAIAARVHWYLFYRGFVEKVALDAQRFLATAEDLWQLAPIRRLALTGVGPVLEELLRCPRLARLVSLDLEGEGVGDHGAEMIAASPYLTKLAWLDLTSNNITSAGVEALAASPKLPALQNVIFDDNPAHHEVKELFGVDQGQIIMLGNDLTDVEKRHGRKTWLHPVYDHGGRTFEEVEL